MWPGSSVVITTELPVGCSVIEFQWGRDFRPVHTDHGAHPAYCKIGTITFPGLNCGRCMLLNTHPLLVSRTCNSTAIPLPTIRATSACNRNTILQTTYTVHSLQLQPNVPFSVHFHHSLLYTFRQFIDILRPHSTIS